MGKSMYFGIASKARNAKRSYLGIANVARKIKKMYVGDASKKARLCFSRGAEAGEVVFTSSQTWSVPEDVNVVEIFCVGGGGGAGGGYSTSTNASSSLDIWSDNFGSAGAGGYTATEQASVTPGESLSIVVGTGGAAGKYYYTENGAQEGTAASASEITAGTGGGTSEVLRGSTALCSAAGGNGGLKNAEARKATANTAYYKNGVNGGSGSGVSRSISGRTGVEDVGVQEGTQGTDGGNGGRGYKISSETYVGTAGVGQGTTTRYFGESDGTLYSTAGNLRSAENSGDGGYPSFATKGSSGIVIIRWTDQ